jgi:hypothetical protein
MSTVLLAVVNPPSAFNTWDIPLNYYGFKHLSIRGAVAVTGIGGVCNWAVSNDGGTSAPGLFGSVLTRTGNANSTSTSLGGANLDIVLADGSASDNYSSIEFFIGDYSTLDSKVNIEATAYQLVSGTTLRMDHLSYRTLVDTNINHFRLFGPSNWNTSSTLRIFGHRG